ncbi:MULTISPECIES: hypothetical protein [Corynebacterium]|uniref:Uncharacterized protein n=1 Tax=Corynebacterium antarcticum TaxID=2800405 RepID=A0A9Q4CB37_9CORY|nr:MULTISPECIES: hypothetical protein [Corynebacterium]MBV7292317.1 hypothetical protein [Corynebacterium sp. TAE3-ERU16]MCX7492912.1 hypothetical protein [Corynebacterium antarcticum]MCX7537648.1 hypothetical protein [Corynebacterium antarcticum]MCX7539199.1 hypothetical protein [Corynebacterium antarcticum]
MSLSIRRLIAVLYFVFGVCCLWGGYLMLDGRRGIGVAMFLSCGVAMGALEGWRRKQESVSAAAAIGLPLDPALREEAIRLKGEGRRNPALAVFRNSPPWPNLKTAEIIVDSLPAAPGKGAAGEETDRVGMISTDYREITRIRDEGDIPLAAKALREKVPQLTIADAARVVKDL